MKFPRLVVWITLPILGFQGNTLLLNLIHCIVISWLYLRTFPPHHMTDHPDGIRGVDQHPRTTQEPRCHRMPHGQQPRSCSTHRCQALQQLPGPGAMGCLRHLRGIDAGQADRELLASIADPQGVAISHGEHRGCHGFSG